MGATLTRIEKQKYMHSCRLNVKEIHHLGPRRRLEDNI